MVIRPRNGLSLCAGGGGLDLGLMLAEPNFHTRCYVEWEEYPRSVLIAGQRAGYFAPAPIWDDVTTFDGRPFRGSIDTILAGYPCQPFSAAGQRKGENDERHLWPDVARIIREVEPRWVLLENVSGHVSLGLETVLRELWDMGWTPAVGIFSAGETGAPHERQRVFIVAYRAGAGSSVGGSAQQPASNAQGGSGLVAKPQRCGGGSVADASIGRSGGPGEGQDQQPRRTETVGAGDPVGNPARLGRGEGRAEHGLWSGWDTVASAGGTVADTSGAGPQRREQRGSPGQWDRTFAHGSTAERSRPRLFPPGPGDSAAWSACLAVAPGLAPAVAFGDIARRAAQLVQMVEQGELAEAQAEPELRLMADGMASRSRALRLLGNGVFPLAAGYAWRTLSAAHGLCPVDLEAASGCVSDRANGDVLK